MPWNDNKGGGGGPWGGGGSSGNGGKDGGESPWGKPGGGSGGPGNKPSGGPGGPGGGKDRPDLEETLRRMQERFRRKDGGGSGGGSGGGGGAGRPRGFGATGLIILLAIAVVGWLFTGIYQVNEQERAVVLRFGTFHRYEEPGFRIRLPSPIERHEIVQVNTELRTRIGGENQANLMLTGDENIVDIDFTINWRIAEPRDYLFNVVDKDGNRNDPDRTDRRERNARSRRHVGVRADHHGRPVPAWKPACVADAADAQLVQGRRRGDLDRDRPRHGPGRSRQRPA